MEILRLEVIRTEDTTGTYYRGTIDLRSLEPYLKVATWSREMLSDLSFEAGDVQYNRLKIPRKIRSIGEYFLNGGNFSTDVILNCRTWDHIRVIPIEGTQNAFILEIPASLLIYIIDGQHRISAKIEIGDLDSPIPFRLCQLSPMQEAMEFYFINYKNTKMPVDLKAMMAYSLFYTEQGRAYTERFPKIAAELEDLANVVNIILQARNLSCEDGNPVKEILRLPDEIDNNCQSISVNSMKKFVEAILHLGNVTDELTETELPVALVNILHSIRKTWPVAWNGSIDNWWGGEAGHPNLILEKSLSAILQCVSIVIREISPEHLRNTLLGRKTLMTILSQIAESLDVSAVETLEDIDEFVTDNNDHFFVSKNQLLNNNGSPYVPLNFETHIRNNGGLQQLVDEVVEI